MAIQLLLIVLLVGSLEAWKPQNRTRCIHTHHWTAWSPCCSGTKTRTISVTQTESCCPKEVPYKNCVELLRAGFTMPGVYEITLPDGKRTPVACLKEGWTVIQSRGQFGNPINYFHRGWNDYVVGFGTPGKEHWLGLHNIYQLTQAYNYRLMIIMSNFAGATKTAFYSKFALKDNSLYRLDLGTYSGTAGDSLGVHRGYPFTTKDRDNDSWSGGNCAVRYLGAWWYTACHRSNLNGYNYGSLSPTPYARGIVYYTFTTHYSSLEMDYMAIR